MNFNFPQTWQACPSAYQQPIPLEQQFQMYMLQLMGPPANIMPTFWHYDNPSMLPSQVYGHGAQSAMSPTMDQYHLESYQDCSTGPFRGRDQRKGQPKTGSPYANQIRHASLAGIRRDPYTGVSHLSRMRATNGAGGWARMSPSGAQSSKPNRRYHGRLRDDISQYRVRIEHPQVAGALAPPPPPSYPPPPLPPPPFPAPSPAAPSTSTSVVSDPPPNASTSTSLTTVPTATKEQPAEDDEDFDTISLGSEPGEYQY